jgi:hypothetical protein
LQLRIGDETQEKKPTEEDTTEAEALNAQDEELQTLLNTYEPFHSQVVKTEPLCPRILIDLARWVNPF